jgi:SNF2 family DNA or RNA helicase
MIEYLSDFTLLFSKPIHLHKQIDEEHLRIVATSLRRLYIFDARDVNYIGNSEYVRWNTTEKTVYYDNLFRFLYRGTNYIMYPYAIQKSPEEIKNDSVKDIYEYNCFVDGSYAKANVIVTLTKTDNESYAFSFYINNTIVQNIVSGKREPKTSMVYEIACNHVRNEIVGGMSKKMKALMSNAPSTVDNIDDGLLDTLKEDIHLYEYQKQDVAWMHNMQKRIDDNTNVIIHKFPLVAKVLESVDGGNVVVCNNTLLPGTFLNNDGNILGSSPIRFHGGNLVSEVGLGKTLVSLCHIFNQHKAKSSFYDGFVENGNNCCYVYKRGTKKGESCKHPMRDGSSFCKSHSNTPFIDKLPLLYKNMENFHLSDFVKDGRIMTNASLVVCPNQLCEQWIQEARSKFTKNYRTLLVVTRAQLENLTLGDILFADLVVISYQLLTNEAYIKTHTKFNIWNSNKFIQLPPQTALSSKNLTCLRLFQWNSLFLDEAHEIQNMTKGESIHKVIKSLQCGSIWNVTGTPFANGVDSLLQLLTYNTNVDYTTPVSTSRMTSWELLSNGIGGNLIEAVAQLYRRNTKKSVESQLENNLIDDCIHELDFTPEERNIYDGYLQGALNKYADFLIQVCCHCDLFRPTKDVVKDCKSLEEIQEKLFAYNTTSLEAKLIELQEAQDRICELESNVCDEEESSLRQIAGAKRHRDHVQSQCDSIRRTQEYLKKAVEKLENESSCPICLEVIQSKTITTCGHVFCKECLNATHHASKAMGAKFKCPSCNTLLNDVYELKSKQVSDKESGKMDISRLVKETKSTKIGNLVHFLTSSINKDDKVIIFSQWDEILHKVGDILKQYGIRIVYCNGSIYQRKNAIDLFSKSPDVNIILLSSRNAASGINLTEANKIVFLEPVYGTEKYRKDIETQAIGRADRIGQTRPIEVHRFIIKDTIEEDIINGNIDETKLRIMTF